VISARRAIVPGADSGYEAFYRAHVGRARSLAHLITGSRQLGQEVAQEAMLAVHEAWPTLEHPEAFLRVVVVNRSRSVQRRQVRERLHRQREAGHEPAGTLPSIDETWAVVQRLPAHQRELLVLRYYEDLSLSDIAELVDQPIGTVKSTLHRALARLKELLDD
jgi:RNA polymerase sigma factor (sigma-70 family)